MTRIETWFTCELGSPVRVQYLDGNIFSMDNQGNLLGVRVYKDGKKADLSGSITANIIRSDGNTVPVIGTVSGNEGTLILPQEAYAIPGPVSIVIKSVEGEVVTTLVAAIATVYQSTTDAIVNPGEIIPSLVELLAEVANMRQATADATTATGSANTAAAYANEKGDYADQMATEASRVNVDMTKTDKVISITTTNRNNVSTTKTSQEPTLRVTKEGVTVTLTATDADGTTTQSFTDAPINDNAGAGDTTSIWSANKIQSELGLKLNGNLKGASNGLAELDSTGHVPASQLPSYVDDIKEYDSLSVFPQTGETDKIYVAKDTNIIYRWSGSAYVEISSTLALGETAQTAYRGDRGKAAYEHAANKGQAFGSDLWVLATNSEGHVISARKATKADIGLGNVDNTADIDKPVSAATRQSEQNAAASATDALNSERDAEAWAVGTRDGVPVTSSDETFDNNAKYYADKAEDAKNVILGMTATASGLPAGSSPTVSYSNGIMTFGIPKGDTGAMGPTATITSSVTQYQNGVSGTTVPTGTWLDNQPETPQGGFLWMRTVLTWSNGQTTTLYTVSRQGRDGASNMSITMDDTNEVLIITT